MIDRALKDTVLTRDFDSHVDRVNRVKTELFMASYHLRAVAYGFRRNAGATEPLGNGQHGMSMEAPCIRMICSPKAEKVRKAFYYCVQINKDLLVGVEEDLISMHEAALDCSMGFVAPNSVNLMVGPAAPK